MNPSVHRTAFVLMTALAALSASADVVFDPSTPVIISRSVPVTVYVTSNGAPVQAFAMGGARFLVDNHDYSHMLRVERMDGSIRLIPTESMEIGTYNLEIAVNGSRVILPVRVTLSDESSSLSTRAREQGLTEMDIQHQLGLYTEGRQSVLVNLPDSYYIGRIVSLRMPTPAGIPYEWYVNGAIEGTGTGPHTFTYPLTTLGDTEFRYVETHPSGDVVVATARTTVRDEPPVPVNASFGRRVHLIGPEGYQRYAWSIGDQTVSEAREFSHRFAEPGEYLVSCTAFENPAIPDEAFRRVLFAVHAP